MKKIIKVTKLRLLLIAGYVGIASAFYSAYGWMAGCAILMAALGTLAFSEFWYRKPGRYARLMDRLGIQEAKSIIGRKP